jgi:hypothetical protein
VVLTCIKCSNEHHRRERDANQHHVEKKVSLDGRTVGRQRSAVLAQAWRPKNSGIFSFVCLVLALQDSAAQNAAARYFVTGSSSQYSLYSSSERIPVRYVFCLALAVEHVLGRAASFNPPSVFVAQVRNCALHPFSAHVAFFPSHYLSRRVNTWL